MTRTLAAIVLALAALPAAAQNQIWIRQFGTSNYDFLYAATTDGSGGVFTSGYTDGSLGGPLVGGNDAWLARHNAAGDQLWVRQLGTSAGDYSYAAAPDDAGGVFVGGYTTGSLGGPNAGVHDAWLARYDSAGALLWVHQLGSIGHDSVSDAASDGMGGVYVTGWTDGNLGAANAGGYDAWLARFDGQGNQLWIRQLGSSVGDFAYASAADGVGGVYVSGYTDGSLGGPSAGSVDAWLACFDSGGNQLWIRQLGTSSADYAVAAAPDGSGGVYLGGDTYFGSLGGTSAGGFDAWLARYDGVGNQLWIRQFGTSQDESVLAAAQSGSVGVFVCGKTLGSLGGSNAGQVDVWFAYYDSTGNKIWIQQLGTSFLDFAWAAAPDGVGGLYVSGFTDGSLGGPNAGEYDAWLARFDPCSAATYCIGAINSTGQGASIGNHGSTSIAQNNLVLTVQGCPPFQPGIFFFGLFQTQVAFGEGWLCVTGQQKRLLPAVFLNASGAGSYQVDFTNPLSPASTIAPGDVRNFQFWYRDPQPVGSGFNLSNGLAAYFCP